MTEDEMVGCHYWLNGLEFEQALGAGEGQGNLTCCSPWGFQRAGHSLVIEQLRDTEILLIFAYVS